MKFTIIAVTLLLIVSCALAAKHGAIHDKESFLKVYNSETPTKDVLFCKKYLKTPETILDRVEYINFLTDFLDDHINDLPKDDEDLREEALLHHKEQAESYLALQNEKDKEDFGLDEVVRDIGIGNFLVYVGNGGFEYAEGEDYDEDTLKFLKENGLHDEDEEDL